MRVNTRSPVNGELNTHPNAAADDLAAKAPQLTYPATLIEPKRYYSSEVMAQEWEHLWTKVWTVAGRTSDLKSVGDYITYELGRETFIIVRASESEIKAFYNVCVHRANPVVQKESGHLLKFTCGFHSWQYDLHGRLIKVTDEEFFPKELICAGLGLRQVRVDTWGGFVFINMDDDAEDLLSFLGIIPKHLAGYHLEDSFIFSDLQMEWDANWKTAMDGFIELYHSHAVHPQARTMWEDKYLQIDCYPKGHSRMLTPWGVVSSRLPVPAELPQELKTILKAAEVDPDKYVGPPNDIREVLVAAKRRLGEKYGLAFYAELSDDQLREAWSYSIFPNWTLNIQESACLFQSWRPHHSDPEKLIYNTMVILPRIKNPNGPEKPAAAAESKNRAGDLPTGTQSEIKPGLSSNAEAMRMANPDIRPKRIYAKDDTGLGPVLKQDYEQAARPQRGLKSRAFAGMRLGGEEVRIRHYLAEIDSYVERGEKNSRTP
jgi:carnitine monooxygenase subunit